MIHCSCKKFAAFLTALLVLFAFHVLLPGTAAATGTDFPEKKISLAVRASWMGAIDGNETVLLEFINLSDRVLSLEMPYPLNTEFWYRQKGAFEKYPYPPASYVAPERVSVEPMNSFYYIFNCQGLFGQGTYEVYFVYESTELSGMNSAASWTGSVQSNIERIFVKGGKPKSLPGK